jgi:hypothetical protein
MEYTSLQHYRKGKYRPHTHILTEASKNSKTWKWETRKGKTGCTLYTHRNYTTRWDIRATLHGDAFGSVHHITVDYALQLCGAILSYNYNQAWNITCYDNVLCIHYPSHTVHLNLKDSIVESSRLNITMKCLYSIFILLSQLLCI